MKSIFAFFLIIITSFGVGYGQCDVDSNSEKHDLEDLEINQRMDMTFYSDSDFESGYILKATDGNTVPVIYQGGIWMGGIDATNSLRVSAKQYLDFENYQPGLLNDDSGLVDEITCENWNQGFTVKRANIDDHILDYEADGQITESTSDDIMFYPAIGNPHFEQKFGFELPQSNQGGLAEFKDRNGNGQYEPLEGDYPLIRGTESTFWVSNDMQEDNEDPIQMEFLVNSSINSAAIELAFSSMIDMKAIYHGKQSLSNFYFGLWIDADLGCVVNDQVGCLPAENLTFYYGTETIECEEGSPFLAGTSPLLLFKHKLNNDQKMSSFISINRESIGNPEDATTDPLNELQVYNYLTGTWLDGQKLTVGNEGYNPGSNDFTNFQYDHSKNAQGGPWKACESEALERDKRTLVSFGPFDLNPGDILDFEFSVHLLELADLACPSEEEILAICDNIDRILNDIDAYDEVETTIYPNPFTNKLTVSSDQAFDQINIYNIQGQLVKRKRFLATKKKPLDTSALSSGVYYMTILSNSATLGSTQKIVKF